MPPIKWITAVYAVREAAGNLREHISVPASGRNALQEMKNELVGTDGLLAVYLTVGGPNPFHPDVARGRVIGLAELIDMPHGRRMEDYPCFSFDGKPRWPIGWPVRWICLPPEENCPVLREHVESLFGEGSLQAYTKRLQTGPFRLEREMQERLTADFAEFDRC